MIIIIIIIKVKCNCNMRRLFTAVDQNVCNEFTILWLKEFHHRNKQSKMCLTQHVSTYGQAITAVNAPAHYLLLVNTAPQSTFHSFLFKPPITRTMQHLPDCNISRLLFHCSAFLLSGLYNCGPASLEIIKLFCLNQRLKGPRHKPEGSGFETRVWEPPMETWKHESF
jgi:hypothetical protein